MGICEVVEWFGNCTNHRTVLPLRTDHELRAYWNSDIRIFMREMGNLGR